MTTMIPDFSLLVTEMFMLGMGCLLLLVDAFISDRHRVFSYAIAQATLLLAALIVILQSGSWTAIGFSGNYIKDAMSDVLKVAILLMMSAGFLYAKDYLKTRSLYKGEFYVLGLFATLGMLVMVSASSLLTVYLGLELLSLCLYALVAFDRDSPSAVPARIPSRMKPTLAMVE